MHPHVICDETRVQFSSKKIGDTATTRTAFLAVSVLPPLMLGIFVPLVAYIAGPFIGANAEQAVNASVQDETVTDTPTVQYSTVIRTSAVVLLVWYCFVVSNALLGTWTIFKRNTRVATTEEIGPGEQAEGVTILRPLKGIDTEMSSCLISALEQDYEKFEIIFCVASPADAAIAVAQELIEKYPKVDAKLLIGEDRYGPNPKINNLAKGYMAAKYDIVWVLDSNVWVSPGALRRSVEEFRRNPKIKIVHHLPMVMAICNDSSNWGARLDEMFMLTAHSKFYTAINQLAVAACVMGKSNLYRRSTLDAAVNKGFGEGIRDFALYIAEDNMIADAIWRAGGRSAMTSDTVVQPQRNVSYRGYVSRRVRWLRVRRYMVFFATLIEPTTESIVCGIMGSFALSVVAFQGSSTFSWTYFLLHLVVWCIIDYWNFHNLTAFANVEYSSGNAPYFMSRYYSPDVLVSGQPRPLREWLVVWAMRELLALPIWVKAMCGQTVMWRNRPFRIKPDLTAEEVLFS